LEFPQDAQEEQLRQLHSLVLIYRQPNLLLAHRCARLDANITARLHAFLTESAPHAMLSAWTRTDFVAATGVERDAQLVRMVASATLTSACGFSAKSLLGGKLSKRLK